MPLPRLPLIARIGLLSALAPVALPSLARALPQEGQAPAAAPQAADRAAPALIAERCTVCHDLAQVTSARKSAADWTETLDRMVGYGATLSPAERDAVLHRLIRDNGLPPAR